MTLKALRQESDSRDAVGVGRDLNKIGHFGEIYSIKIFRLRKNFNLSTLNLNLNFHLHPTFYFHTITGPHPPSENALYPSISPSPCQEPNTWKCRHSSRGIRCERITVGGQPGQKKTSRGNNKPLHGKTSIALKKGVKKHATRFFKSKKAAWGEDYNGENRRKKATRKTPQKTNKKLRERPKLAVKRGVEEHAARIFNHKQQHGSQRGKTTTGKTGGKKPRENQKKQKIGNKQNWP